MGSNGPGNGTSSPSTTGRARITRWTPKTPNRKY
ncbi:hypothetical protein COLO4_14823 [Corchorus olitorius]|uniref:Uncharacterized protein n=1 Tax=Corchorus olitorius TaxID=93759 RepID=A0A1R3JQR4_9ROSI|nr:hypothetical protein COLO4_14823 [Corchorus olitorius]